MNSLLVTLVMYHRKQESASTFLSRRCQGFKELEESSVYKPLFALCEHHVVDDPYPVLAVDHVFAEVEHWAAVRPEGIHRVRHKPLVPDLV